MKWVVLILRIGVFGIFFGHGILAIQGNAIWINYLQFVGFNLSLSQKILPIIGMIDVGVALSMLYKPIKPILLYAFVWAFATALIRPLAGEPIWSFVERAGNWATPLALLLLSSYKGDHRQNAD